MQIICDGIRIGIRSPKPEIKVTLNRFDNQKQNRGARENCFFFFLLNEMARCIGAVFRIIVQYLVRNSHTSARSKHPFLLLLYRSVVFDEI